MKEIRIYRIYRAQGDSDKLKKFMEVQVQDGTSY